MSIRQSFGADPALFAVSDPSTKDHVRYYSRYALVELKSALGLRLSSDKRHMCERIARGARSGEIVPETVLAVEIRRDGFGSQVLSRLSVEAAALDLGLTYAHRPFEVVAHAEGDPTEWVQRCETTFSLGRNRRQFDDFDYPQIDLVTYARSRKLWHRPHIVTMNNMHVYCDRNPAIYRSVIDAGDAARVHSGERLQVAVHFRRGDVSAQRVSHRFTANRSVMSTLQQVASAVERAGLAHDVTVYSNGNPEEFAEFADIGCHVDVRSGALEAFRQLRASDILVTAKSTFSYVAGLYSNGVVLYEPFGRSPLPWWIRRSTDGRFSMERLAEQLSRYRTK
jgi:hypothetical protein